MTRRFPYLALSLLAVALWGCECEPPPVAAGDICGSGVVDGAPHAIVAEASRLILTVERASPDGPCGVFHSHVVEATAAVVEYDIDSANADNSSMTITVAAAGLDVDDPALREEFLADGENQPLSEGDRKAIRGSVADEVKANEHPELVFSVKDLTVASGEGEGTLTATLAGETSDVPMRYTVTKDGNNLVINGSAVLAGGPYGIPRNSLGFCVDPDMDLHLELTLAPGSTACDGVEAPPPYEETFFDDPACAENVGFNEARDVAVRRCAGCHNEEPILGATIPLISWEDYRTDSLRNDDVPAYLTAHELVHLSPEEGLSMPPAPVGGELLATGLSDEELALFDAWVEDGARDEACENDPGVRHFGARAPVNACDDASNFETGEEGARPKDFFTNACAYCHVDTFGFYQGVPQIALLDGQGAVVQDDLGNGVIDHGIANEAGLHPFYIDDAGVPLSFWQMSVERVKDGSMPPGSTADAFADDPAFAAFVAWVEDGAKLPCD